jgi:ribosomal protein L37AE/L43A
VIPVIAALVFTVVVVPTVMLFVVLREFRDRHGCAACGALLPRVRDANGGWTCPSCGALLDKDGRTRPLA